MARYRKEFTLSKDTIEYLKNFDNASKTIDAAIELHKNFDKKIIETPQNPQIKVRLHA